MTGRVYMYVFKGPRVQDTIHVNSGENKIPWIACVYLDDLQRTFQLMENIDYQLLSLVDCKRLYSESVMKRKVIKA